MKRRILALMTAMTMALSLGACGLFGTEKEQGTSEDENTLTVWCWGQPSWQYAMEEAAAMYQEEHPEFRIAVTEHSWEDIQKQLQEAGSSGDVTALPDILLVRDQELVEDTDQMADLFADLSESGIDFSQFDEHKTQQTTVDDVLYGLPMDQGTMVLMMRTDLLEKAGLTIDDFTNITWEAFDEMGRTVLEKTGQPMLVVRASGRLRERIPDAVYQTMKEDGVLIEVESEDQYLSAVSGEDTVALIDNCEIFAELMNGNIGAGNWALTNLPAEAQQGDGGHYDTDGGCSWMVTANCEKRELAFDFLKNTFGSSTDLYETLLEDAGLLGSYLPLRQTRTFSGPQAFFDNQTIYVLLTDFNERALQVQQQ